MSIPIHEMVDHTLLKPDSTKAQIIQLVKEAKEYRFASVCVHPYWIKYVSELLKDFPTVKVCAVIGFPLGANTKEVKAFEAKQAIEDGATELDMVINIGALKDGNDTLVKEDISAVVEMAKRKAITKVIIETSLLTEEEKVRACQNAKNAGAHFVKTSTGFASGGATVDDIKLMREVVGTDIGVKASGGVRDIQTAHAMIEAGATRIGTSSGVTLIKGEKANTNY